MIIYLTIIFFIFGAVFGSFLNVIIYRLPRGESIIYPASHCPVCGAKILPRDNIPILSYIILKRRCRNCGAKILPIYIIVESITALIFTFGFLYYGLSFSLLEFLTFCLILIPIAFIDWNTMLIPDSLSIGGTIVGLIFSIFGGKIVQSLMGGIISGGILLIFAIIGRWIFHKEAMGFGDVKMAVMLGVFVGWQEFIILLVIASFIGAIYGLIMEIRGKIEDSKIPFAPFLAIGGIIAYVIGRYAINFYFGI